MFNIKRKDTIRKIRTDFLTCPICLEDLKNPKCLLCLHKFCETCLEEYVEIKGITPGKKLECPLRCKELTKLPSNKVAGLKTDFTLKALVTFLKQKEEQYATYSEISLPHMTDDQDSPDKALLDGDVQISSCQTAGVNTNAEQSIPNRLYPDLDALDTTPTHELYELLSNCFTPDEEIVKAQTEAIEEKPKLLPRLYQGNRPTVLPPPRRTRHPSLLSENKGDSDQLEASAPDYCDYLLSPVRTSPDDKTYEDMMKLAKQLSLREEAKESIMRRSEEEQIQLAKEESLKSKTASEAVTRVHLSDINNTKDIDDLTIIQLQYILDCNNIKNDHYSTRSHLAQRVKQLYLANKFQSRPLPNVPTKEHHKVEEMVQRSPARSTSDLCHVSPKLSTSSSPSQFTTMHIRNDMLPIKPIVNNNSVSMGDLTTRTMDIDPDSPGLKMLPMSPKSNIPSQAYTKDTTKVMTRRISARDLPLPDIPEP